MKLRKIILLVGIAIMAGQLNAQFSRATLQATGLTCAMCSNAINKALLTRPFIASVKPDIKNSSFAIVFKENVSVDIDEIRKAVEDAGFSVGQLKLTGNFHDVKVGSDGQVQWASINFVFVNTSNRTLEGEQTLTVVDKDFLTAKQFKKYSQAIKVAGLQTGKPGTTSSAPVAGARVYHVTI